MSKSRGASYMGISTFKPFFLIKFTAKIHVKQWSKKTCHSYNQILCISNIVNKWNVHHRNLLLYATLCSNQNDFNVHFKCSFLVEHNVNIKAIVVNYAYKVRIFYSNIKGGLYWTIDKKYSKNNNWKNRLWICHHEYNSWARYRAISGPTVLKL